MAGTFSTYPSLCFHRVQSTASTFVVFSLATFRLNEFKKKFFLITSPYTIPLMVATRTNMIPSSIFPSRRNPFWIIFLSFFFLSTFTTLHSCPLLSSPLRVQIFKSIREDLYRPTISSLSHRYSEPFRYPGEDSLLILKYHLLVDYAASLSA
jgi:hypothetical protein